MGDLPLLLDHFFVVATASLTNSPCFVQDSPSFSAESPRQTNRVNHPKSYKVVMTRNIYISSLIPNQGGVQGKVDKSRKRISLVIYSNSQDRVPGNNQEQCTDFHVFHGIKCPRTRWGKLKILLQS